MRALRRKRSLPRIAAACAALLPQAPALGQDAAPFGLDDALRNGRFTFELRPRYNRIDESDRPLRSEGGTGRALAGWRSAPRGGVRVTVEGIVAYHLGGHFNDDPEQFSTSPYPLLPDPRYKGVNQAHFEYTGGDALRLRAGRQVVRMGNQRWISDNDFRQIPQVFDGVLASYAALAGMDLTAGHFRRMRDTSGITQELRLSLLHAAWNPAAGHAITAYGYFHDQPQNGAFTGYANNSYRVAGIRAEGTATRIGTLEIPYELEYAIQRPHAGGDARIRAPYWRAGAGVAHGESVVRLDYEVKGSNRGMYAVQMPLTDFYAFNGWALHFFNTPRQGLRDGWVTLRHRWHALTFYAEAHRFRSDFGGIGFGRELDAGVTYGWNEHLTLRLQHARYDPGAGTDDPRVRKTWLTLTYAY